MILPLRIMPPDQRQTVLVKLTPSQVFIGSIVTLLASALMLIGVSLGWRDIFTVFTFSSGLMVHPLLAYISIRLMTEIGWAWRLFSALLASVLGLGLWTWAAYIVVHLRYT